jgi:hypothetical protein
MQACLLLERPWGNNDVRQWKPEGSFSPANKSSGGAAPCAMISPVCHHGQHDIVKVFLEFEDKLDVSNFVGDTKVYGLGGTDKIHRAGWLTRPGTDILYVKARLFLLEQNPHRYRSLFCCAVFENPNQITPHPK